MLFRPSACSIIQSIARLKKAGAKTQPCLRLDDVLRRSEMDDPTLTRATVVACRSCCKPLRNCGVPIPLRANRNADLSTESNADFKSTYATQRGRLNSLCISYRSLRASIASAVDRPAAKPDCSGRRWLVSRGLRRSRSTWANTLPWTERREIGL